MVATHMLAFDFFLKKKAKDFRNISAKTNGELEAEQLYSGAWEAGEYPGRAKRGHLRQFISPAFNHATHPDTRDAHAL